MIFGNFKSGLVKMTALQFIESSIHTFHLTGSRRFDTHNETSDYDFFVQDTQQVRDSLEQFGFKLDTKSYNTNTVLTRVYKKENVHVQCVMCAMTKEWVQGLLYPIFNKLKPGKEEAKMIWKTAMKLYVSGLNGKLNKTKLLDPPPPFKDKDDYYEIPF